MFSGMCLWFRGIKTAFRAIKWIFCNRVKSLRRFYLKSAQTLVETRAGFDQNLHGP